MTKNRSRDVSRSGVIAALTITVLVGCEGGFDAGKFADEAASSGAMTKQQGRCVAAYVDKYGSEQAKDELQKLAEEGDVDPDTASVDPELAEEIGDLMTAAAEACLPDVTTP